MSELTMTRSDITEVPVRVSVVTKVERGSYTDDEGWSLGLPDDLPFDVEPGMVAEQWGRGIGYTVRGLAIDGHVVRYRTEKQQAVDDALAARRAKAAQVEAYVDNRARQDSQYEALPAPFQRRLDRFRAGCPEFRWEFEPYELAVCADAVRIAEHFGHRADLISAFAKRPWAEQVAEVEGLDDGHSGNSFSAAVHLARAWVLNPEAVVYGHGALVPLVGCEAYGCTHGEESA